MAIVTGGAGGIGYEVALGLAQGYADVVVAGRSESKGYAAVGMIRTLAPSALVRFERVDLSSLESIAAFANRLQSAGRAVDLLVNNAGVMALPRRRVTADGFEMQLGTNYLGHFALTARLLPLLRRSRRPRVVQVSSLAHRYGRIGFEDLQGERKYRPWRAYAQSKLAMLLFSRELQRQSDAHGWGLLSSAAHPGYAQTELFANGPGRGSILSRVNNLLGRSLGQPAASGALPILFAAISENAQPGGFYGPGGPFELAGSTAVARLSSRVLDRNVARKLWQVSEQLTGVTFAKDGVDGLYGSALA